jgi:hypothetical protein
MVIVRHRTASVRDGASRSATPGTLFAMSSGIVPDGIEAHPERYHPHFTDVDPMVLHQGSHRAGNGEPAAIAVRVLDRWLECSAGLRERSGELAGRMWI